MAAEKTQIPGDHVVLCLGSTAGGGPDKAVLEDTGSEHVAGDETARGIVEVDRRQVARYKPALREFKLSVIATVVLLAFGLGLLLSGALDHDLSLWWRRSFMTCGALECLLCLYGISCHLREFGLSVPEITGFSNEEHQPPPLGDDRC